MAQKSARCHHEKIVCIQSPDKTIHVSQKMPGTKNFLTLQYWLPESHDHKTNIMSSESHVPCLNFIVNW